MLERLLSVLDERERTILELRFQHDLTQHEIAARVGLSQMQVSRLLGQAITRLQAVGVSSGFQTPLRPEMGRRGVAVCGCRPSTPTP